ncbi:MAG: nucleotidyltransferase family protein, partial [Thermoleophilia bacterium]|nr:nucleotidyltransferase family protein [Thermoleophilia bacterium]
RPVTPVANPARDRGMSSSLRVGLATVLDGGGATARPDAVIFLVGDQPFVTSAIVDKLIESFVESGKAIVRPAVNGRPTHPVLMSALIYDELLRQEGDVGGREVIARHPDEVYLVPVEGERLALDIDTWEDVEKLAALAGAAAKDETQNPIRPASAPFGGRHHGQEEPGDLQGPG